MPTVQRSANRTASGKLSVLSGEVTLYGGCCACEDTRAESQLSFEPNRPIIIGRAEGSIPYLHSSYQATTIMPNTGRTVLLGESDDLCVSRGHFSLWSYGAIIVLVNGVPNPEGKIRAPLNGTRLLEPEERLLRPQERYPIRRGESILVRLPNGAEIGIECE